MTIRTRVAAIVLGTMVAAVAVTSVITSRILLVGFESLEAADATADVERAVHEIDAALETLAFRAIDWAMSDDTYAFMADRREDHPWVESNLVDETFAALETEVFLVADRDGQVVLELAYDDEGVNPVGVPDELRAALLGGGVLADVGDGEPAQQGLLRTAGGALLVAAREVTDSTGSTQPRGVLVLARWLDGSLVEQWSSRSGLDLRVETVASAGTANGSEGPTVEVADGQIVATASYPDVEGRPFVSVSVTQPRDIVETGRFSLAIFLFVMIATLGAATLVLTPLLDRSILRRLRQLTAETTDVGVSGHVDERVTVDGRDEVTALARSINTMLASLERAHQEQELRNVELAQALEGKDRFVSTVAHELRTPITALKGLALTLLRAEGRLPPERQEELLGRIAERTDRMHDLVEELLTMSRLAAGKIHANPLPMHVPTLVDNLLDDLATVMAGVETDLDDDVYAMADPDHLTRILINLLENARRYGAPPIEIVGRTEGDEIVVCVVDHGPGVSPDQAERLFQSFEQMETTSGQGLGLGLSIVRSLAELNGGDVGCTPTPGGGATFVVRLPAATVEDYVLRHHIAAAGDRNVLGHR